MLLCEDRNAWRPHRRGHFVCNHFVWHTHRVPAPAGKAAEPGGGVFFPSSALSSEFRVRSCPGPSAAAAGDVCPGPASHPQPRRHGPGPACAARALRTSVAKMCSVKVHRPLRAHISRLHSPFCFCVVRMPCHAFLPRDCWREDM